jgi:hypothetical protein
VLFGLSMVVVPAVPERLFTWMLFDGEYPGAFGDGEVEYVRFVTGVLGAVLAGWGVLIVFLLAGPVRRCDPWAWEALVVSLFVWYVADSAMSLWTGFWENAVLNSGIGLLFIVGLVGIRPGPPEKDYVP